jgi:hypothetical protein
VEPLAIGFSLTAAAQKLLQSMDWEKVACGYAKTATTAIGKALWTRLTGTDQDRVRKVAVGLFVEHFTTELEDKVVLSSAVAGFRDQLKHLVEFAWPELSECVQPEASEMDLDRFARLWGELGLDPLPSDFDWQLVSKNFARSIRKILKENPLFSNQLSIALQETIAEQTQRMAEAGERIAGPAPGFDVAGYRTYLRYRCGGLQLSLLHSTTYSYDRRVSLWKVFIPQTARLTISEDHSYASISSTIGYEGSSINMQDDSPSDSDLVDRTASSPVLDLLSRERLLVILGDPGSGKTSLLNYCALKWVEEGLDPLPLRVDLRQYVQDRIGLLRWFQSASSSFRLDATHIDALLVSGAASLHLDGLDEVFDHPLRSVVVDEIVAISARYPSASIIVTSRTLGYEPDTLRNAGFQVATLEQLTMPQIDEFLVLWHNVAEADEAERSRLRGRLRSAIRDSRPIRELAGNPLLLTMMAILNRTQPLPRNRVELYREASRVLVHEWETRRLLPDDTLDQQDKLTLLRDLAGIMQGTPHGLAGNLINRGLLASTLRDFLRGVGISNPYDKAKALVTQLTERNFILCYAGADSFCFVHRTFLEYFAACWFIYKFQVEQSISFAELRTNVFGAHWKDQAWHEVLCLISGMIGERYSEQLLLFLLEQDGRDEKQINLRLAAQCLAELRNRHGLAATEHVLYTKINDNVLRYSPRYYVSESEERRECRDVREHAVFLIATSWHGDDTRSWLQHSLDNDPDRLIRQAAVRELARTWAESPDTHRLILDRARYSKHWDVRKAALQVLVQGWKDDPQTHGLLLDLAQTDLDWDVRRAVIEELARGWKSDRHTYPLLLDAAVHDLDWLVRRASIQALARGWKDAPQTRVLLEDRLQNDENRLVQSAALQELARGWKNDPSILVLVKQQISYGGSLEVRSAAVQELAAEWRDDPDVHEEIFQLALHAEHGDVRLASIEELAQTWQADPRTQPVLLDLAQSDKRSSVRQTALTALARKWRENPSTYSLLLQHARVGYFGTRCTALSELARGWRTNPEIYYLLLDCAQHDRIGPVRQTALHELCRHWPADPKTYELLHQASVSDEFRGVRQTGVRDLARGWREEPDVKALLLDRVRKDTDPAVRQASVRELSRGWSNDMDAFHLLLDRARNDVAAEVRAAATQELVWRWQSRPEVYELICTLTFDDASLHVRKPTVQELARNYGDDPQTIRYVQKLATEDGAWQVRKVALEELIRGWRGDPSTSKLLIQSACSDESSKVRLTCVRELSRTWSHDPDVALLLVQKGENDPDSEVRKAAKIRRYHVGSDGFEPKIA